MAARAKALAGLFVSVRVLRENALTNLSRWAGESPPAGFLRITIFLELAFRQTVYSAIPSLFHSGNRPERAEPNNDTSERDEP
jgi:hypothetical protein